MTDEPRIGRRTPDSLKALLALILLLIVLGVLIGFVLAAIGPSQDPNTGGAWPLMPSGSGTGARPLA